MCSIAGTNGDIVDDSSEMSAAREESGDSEPIDQNCVDEESQENNTELAKSSGDTQYNSNKIFLACSFFVHEIISRGKNSNLECQHSQSLSMFCECLCRIMPNYKVMDCVMNLLLKSISE